METKNEKQDIRKKYPIEATGVLKFKGEIIAELEEIYFCKTETISGGVKGEFGSSVPLEEYPKTIFIHGIIYNGYILSDVCKTSYINFVDSSVKKFNFGETIEMITKEDKKITLKKVEFNPPLDIKPSKISNVKFFAQYRKSSS